MHSFRVKLVILSKFPTNCFSSGFRRLYSQRPNIHVRKMSQPEQIEFPELKSLVRDPVLESTRRKDRAKSDEMIIYKAPNGTRLVLTYVTVQTLGITLLGICGAYVLKHASDLWSSFADIDVDPLPAAFCTSLFCAVVLISTQGILRRSPLRIYMNPETKEFVMIKLNLFLKRQRIPFKATDVKVMENRSYMSALYRGSAKIHNCYYYLDPQCFGKPAYYNLVMGKGWEGSNTANNTPATWLYLLICCLPDVQANNRWISRRAWIPKSCEAEQCYPSTGDLLIGRERQLKSSSTCGLHEPERFCTVSHETIHRAPQCMYCDSTKPYHSTRNHHSHRIENIVTPNKRDPNRWFQSENGIEEVTIQLDLEAEFHFTHLMMRFKTFRPQSMVIERSSDFGRTWNVYRYFADNCTAFWPGIKAGQPTSLAEVVCDERYSGETPSSNGEVVFRALPQAQLSNPWAEEVQNLLKITNLRVNFTKLRTLGDDLLDTRPEVKDKYYYAVYNMVVRGSCSCYGHAANCVPMESLAHDTPNMVYGRCNCTHNTQGNNCEQCADFYWDAPWRPAIGANPNECKRCECNGHASRCHFDPSIYAATGLVSGGVCDDCGDNTEGIHCERCKPHFFLADDRQINEKDACQPCDCDPNGQTQECDWMTNMALGLKAGRCYCKPNVVGPRCDTCKGGYYNLTRDDPEGCQPCDCYWPGVLRLSELENPDLEDEESQLPPCDPLTGDCTCKRNVMGERCQECYPYHFWKTSEELDKPQDTEGCLPCECDLGGAYGSQCDLHSGLCGCRPHVQGRTCNQTDNGYWLQSLDSLRLEAEEAMKTSGRTQLVEIGPLGPGVKAQHTGTGHILIWDDTSVYFNDVRVPFPTHYDVVMRYKLDGQFPWRQLEVMLDRPRPASEGNGICANVFPDDDTIDTEYEGVEIPPTKGAFKGVRIGTFCFEPEQNYGLTLRVPKDSQPEVNSFLEVDSIVLMPAQSYVPLFLVTTSEVEALREEFERERCEEILQSVNDPQSDLSSTCRKLVFSIAASMTTALPCECDSVGSHNNSCYYLGGQCPCRDNYIGRRCDRCAPQTYRLPGSTDCIDCSCSDAGSVHRSCSNSTGQCPCHELVEGRTCDKCQIGYFGFPRCQECACNGLAVQCREPDGVCINCREHTTGPHCTTCNDTFYGDPLRYREMGWDSPCRRCNCPGLPPNGPQHAESCSLITSMNGYSQESQGSVIPQDFVCHCKTGYSGQYCDQCAPNYFGKPASTDPMDACKPCNCNDHIDQFDSGNCDSTSGTCLKCLDNTVGTHCQTCAKFYWGDATDNSIAPGDRCKPCLCFVIGVNASIDCPEPGEWRGGYGQCACNTDNGKCNCLPNVVGDTCDQCLPAHYGLATGKGCLPCECDTFGAENEFCDDEGICKCKEGFGGRRCNQCPDGKWGDPHANECKGCDCDPIGTIPETYCEKETGQCQCRPGITGLRCDTCARGTTGENPSDCKPCGECFDNWDVIFQQLKGNASQLLVEAERVRETGVSTAFKDEFSGAEEAIISAEEALNSWPKLKDDYSKLRDDMGDLANELITGDECLPEDDMDLEEEMPDNFKVTMRTTDRLCTVERNETRLLKELDAWSRGAAEITAKIDAMQSEVKNYHLNATTIFDAADAGANKTIAEEAEMARKDFEIIQQYAEQRQSHADGERTRLEQWFEQSQERLLNNAHQLSMGIGRLAQDVLDFEQELKIAPEKLCLSETQQCSLYLKNAQTALEEGRKLIKQRNKEAEGRLTVLNSQNNRLTELSANANEYLIMARDVCGKLNGSKAETVNILDEASELLRCNAPDELNCGVRLGDLEMIEGKLDELSLIIEDSDLAGLVSNLTEAAQAISKDTDMARLLAETEPQLEATERIAAATEKLEKDAKSVTKNFLEMADKMASTKESQLNVEEILDNSLLAASNARSTLEPIRQEGLTNIETKNLAASKTVDAAKREATILHGDFVAAKDSITRIDSMMAGAELRRQEARNNLTEISSKIDDIASRFSINDNSNLGIGSEVGTGDGAAGKIAERASEIANEISSIRGKQMEILGSLEQFKQRGAKQEEQLRQITGEIREALKRLAALHSHHATCAGGQPRASPNRNFFPAPGGNQPQLRPRYENQKRKKGRSSMKF